METKRNSRVGKATFWGGVVTGLAGVLMMGSMFLPSSPSGAEVAANSFLKEAHKGSTNPGFTEGECPDEGWGWHFVLQGNETTFVSIKVTFENEGVVTTFDSQPTGKHAYVYTSGPDTLVDAEAVVDGPDTEFNLSHVCTGPEETTTTTVEETTTTVEETTTTEATTTSEVLASTTEQEFTTTTEAAATTLPTDVQPAELARTGAESTSMAAFGSILLATGGALVLAGRRRQALGN